MPFNNTYQQNKMHLRRLISAFVIRSLESIISKLASGEISIFSLVSVAEETGLRLVLSETPRTGFVAPVDVNIYCKLGKVHCICLGVSGYIFQNILFFCLTIFFLP